MLIKHTHANAQDLIDISREMLSLTSGIWKERDRLVGLHGDFEWLVCCYSLDQTPYNSLSTNNPTQIMYHAVPASGIICVELLKQTKDPLYHHIIHRSESIQDLIMFTGFLDWVKPGAPNYELCRRIREIIGRVLEKVVESPRAKAEKPTAQETALDFHFDDLREFDDYATFDLLDTFDWFNETWITQS